MNATLKTVLVAVLLALAMTAGYWLGNSRSEVGSRKSEVHTSSGPTDTAKGKVLYYRNPMGLPDTSPMPKKDPMGMDYIPVYEGDDAGGTGTDIRISTDKVQKLGVRTETAALRTLERTVRAVGTLEADERRIHTVAPRFEGWIEALHVNTTGQPVGRGQPLMEVYSPDLVTAQQEYLVAAKGLEAVAGAGPEAQESMRRLMPGEALYKISDLSALWLIVDVFEQDLGLIRPGQTATISVNAYPGKPYSGKVAYFYPTISAATRTGKVRIELANPGGLLKPNMYATVTLATGAGRKVLAVPDSAVIDSGVRRVVLVQRAEGRFEPREVKLGARADDHVEILEGVSEGEAVVVSANFLIDAESNLRAAIGGLAAPGQPAGGAKAPAPGHRGEGTVDALDASSGKVKITHGPIPSLKWPGMTMDFVLANPALGANLEAGAAVAFEFVERKPGEYVVTSIERKGAGKAISAPPGHGH
jgi:Cu(I)/Ag(I) efflux system membrane fusion protein